MTADTYSARLGMLEMGTGNQNNSWGTSFNSSVTDIIDRAIAGVVTRSNTGGALDLSGSPPPAGARADLDAIQIFNGTLTSDLTVTVPNLSKIWDVCNFTSGAFGVFFKTASGTAVQIPQGCRRRLILDGANNIYREDRDEVGKFTHSARTTPAPGELVCNGASLLRVSFPDLFTAIGTTWGTADGTHFTLPNLQNTGRFLRSSTGSLTVGTYQSNQNLAHTHSGATFSATTSGVSAFHSHGVNGPTDVESAAHNHNITVPTSTTTPAIVTGGASAFFWTGTQAAATGSENQTHAHTVNINSGTDSVDHTHTLSGTTGTIPSSGGAEARPESAVALICIKY